MQLESFKLYLFILFIVFIVSCDDKRDGNFCPGVTVTAVASADEKLYIKGSFNNWSLSTPMFFDDGKWSVELFLAPGDYPYKLY